MTGRSLEMSDYRTFKKGGRESYLVTKAFSLMVAHTSRNEISLVRVYPVYSDALLESKPPYSTGKGHRHHEERGAQPETTSKAISRA